MPTFTDSAGQAFTVQFDGLLLGIIRDATGHDLADVTGEHYLKLKLDSVSLVRVAALLCGEQLQKIGLTDKQFSARVTGKHLEELWLAVWGAAELFFPPSLWSGLASAFNQRLSLAAMKPMLSLLQDPTIPPGIREAMTLQIAERLSTASPASAGQPSVSGPEASPPNSASDSPDSAESTPAA